MIHCILQYVVYIGIRCWYARAFRFGSVLGKTGADAAANSRTCQPTCHMTTRWRGSRPTVRLAETPHSPAESKLRTEIVSELSLFCKFLRASFSVSGIHLPFSAELITTCYKSIKQDVCLFAARAFAKLSSPSLYTWICVCPLCAWEKPPSAVQFRISRMISAWNPILKRLRLRSPPCSLWRDLHRYSIGCRVSVSAYRL